MMAPLKVSSNPIVGTFLPPDAPCPKLLRLLREGVLSKLPASMQLSAATGVRLEELPVAYRETRPGFTGRTIHKRASHALGHFGSASGIGFQFRISHCL